MNKLDFDAVNQAMDARTVVPQWAPGGTWRGDEYMPPNPTRDDRNPGSFVINVRKGVWIDYALGDDAKGSDLVSLYAYLFHGGNQGTAVKELAENLGVRIGDPVVREQAAANNVAKIDPPKPEIIFPVPAGANAPTFKHPSHGQPSSKWEYRDREGRLLMYVCRFDPPGERKQVVPYSWCRHPDGTERWTWRGITGAKKRPLYGLERLAADPEADAIVVEGEKTADAGQRLFGASAIVCTWMGGVETADRVNINALAGRRVVLWPDFDAQVDKATGVQLPFHEQPGIRAMMNLATSLKGVAREIIMVGYTPNQAAHGWDLADAEAEGWTTEQTAAYMVKNAGDPWHIASPRAAPAPAHQASPPAPAQPPAPPAPPPANDNAPKVPLDAPVNQFGWPHLTDKGQPLNTIENLQYMLGEYGITARYNQISKDVEIRIPGMRFSQDNHMAASLATMGSLCARNRMPKADLAEYIMVIADANEYNPAAEWIDSRPWDGVDRLGPLAATLDPLDADLAAILLRRWMIGAAGCVYEPNGMSMQGVLVLQGEQYSGKTTWFWSLVNRDKKLGKEGANINPSDRDSVKPAVSYWLVELGEIDATFRKADIAALKSFLTRDFDELFLRYSRASSKFPRRTAFVGTVNPKHYLHDETGNRRYWTIRHGANLRGIHDVDMQQAWAQAKTLWASGEQHRLTREEMDRLNALNMDHTEPSSIEELILAEFDWTAARTALLSASEVLLAIGFDKPNNKQAKDASGVLRKLTGGEPHKSSGRLVFKMPPRVGVLAKARRHDGAGLQQQREFDHHDENRPF